VCLVLKATTFSLAIENVTQQALFSVSFSLYTLVAPTFWAKQFT
jgi:hypothetical protein